MSPNLTKLSRRIDDCSSNEQFVHVIRLITRTGDPDAIAVLASLLECPGEVGLEAVRGLYTFGQFAEAEMRRVVAESMEETAIRNAHRVLARLGDRYSRRAVHAVCWADLDAKIARENAEAAVAAAKAANNNGTEKAG